MMDTTTLILSALLVLMGVYITHLHAKLAVTKRAVGMLLMYIASEEEQTNDDE